MNEDKLGTVIARRLFDCGDNNVILEIGAPYPMDGDGPDHWCPYRLNGLGDGKVRRAGGVDSMQALYLAMQAASADLYAANAGRDDKITWLGQRNLGLPFLKAVADLVPPEDE